MTLTVVNLLSELSDAIKPLGKVDPNLLFQPLEKVDPNLLLK